MDLAASNDINITRVVAVFCYLNKYPNILNERVVSTTLHKDLQTALLLQTQSYCWLPIVSNPPECYPTSLKWKGSLCSPNLASPRYSPLVVLSQNKLNTIANDSRLTNCFCRKCTISNCSMSW